MSPVQALCSIAVMAAVTFFTRALPFVLFDRGARPPAFVLYLGRVLPAAIIAMLIVYCLRGLDFSATGRWLPQLIAGGTVVCLHLWKRNHMLSIFGGTALYMFLVQAVLA